MATAYGYGYGDREENNDEEKSESALAKIDRLRKRVTKLRATG